MTARSVLTRLTLAVAALAPAPVGGQAPVKSIDLPTPWGPHVPGVRTLLVTDSTRADTISAREGDFRPILVRVWYPSEGPSEGGGAVRGYMDATTAEAWRGTLPGPGGFETGVQTNAVADAPLSEQQRAWPVLLLSPGRSFPTENYQITLEHLASMGWVVAAISPPYEEASTVLPDGRVLPFSGPRWSSEEQRGPVLMSVVDEMVLDASLVVDRLEALVRTPGDPFYRRLDLERGVGYLGHSLGGAAAAWTLERDPRVIAAASWEGQVYRDEDRPLAVSGGALLYVIGGANRRELVGTQYRPGGPEGVVHEVVIRGAWHASFGDLLYIYRHYADRDWHERHRREVPASRVNQITNDYLHEFFSHYLLGGELDLFWPDSPDEAGTPSRWDYPEVELRTYVPGPGEASPD